MEWFQFIYSIAKDFGVPVAILVVFVLGVWLLMRWFGAQIVIPIRDTILARVVRFFDKLEGTLDALTHNVESVSGHMEVQTAILQRVEARQIEQMGADRTGIQAWQKPVPGSASGKPDQSRG
jgi:hypothetical protein